MRGEMGAGDCGCWQLGQDSSGAGRCAYHRHVHVVTWVEGLEGYAELLAQDEPRVLGVKLFEHLGRLLDLLALSTPTAVQRLS